MRRNLAVLFSLFLVESRAALLHNTEHLLEIILSWEDATCPGTVVVFDKQFWLEEHAFIDDLVLRFPRPLTLLQSRANYGLLTESDGWSGGSAAETVCNNVIIFNRYPADLTSVYRQLNARYPYIGQVFVVTTSSSDQVDRFLYEFRNQRILLVLDRPWRSLELRSCCWGQSRSVRSTMLEPNTLVRWEEFGVRYTKVQSPRQNEDNSSA